MDLDQLAGRRALNMPGISCTVEEQIEALREVAGTRVTDLIKHEPDETIINIVKGWPRNFSPERAIELGFKADESFKAIIETYIAEDMHPTE